MPKYADESGAKPRPSRDVRGAIKEDTVLHDRYRVMDVLGMGGMGAVYKALDLRFPNVERWVAVKEMQTVYADPDMRQIVLRSFEREANNLASLDHPAIPKIYDYFSIGDRAYLVMEYIRGRDLKSILENTAGFIHTETVYNWAIALCDVLYYLHSHRPDPIVFRDVKPANIMIDQHKNLRLIDFGIAKTLEMDREGTLIGSAGYAPPEQYQGEATPSGDIYALGATLHYLLTKCDPRIERPFTFPDRPIQNYNPHVSHEFTKVIMRALSYEPENRYVDAALMKAALEQISPLPGSTVPQTRAVQPIAAPPVEAPGTPDEQREEEELMLILSRSPLLRALMKAAPDVMRSALKDEYYKAGTILFRQGDPGDRVYAIWSGKLQVQYDMGHGAPPLIIGERSPGAMVGEMSLLEDEPRSATIVVIEDARLVSLSRENFLRVLGEQDVTLALLRAFSRRVRASGEQIIEASQSFDFLAKRLGDAIASDAASVEANAPSVHLHEGQWAGLNTLFRTFSELIRDLPGGLSLLRNELPADVDENTEDIFGLLKGYIRRAADQLKRIHDWQQAGGGTAHMDLQFIYLDGVTGKLIEQMLPNAHIKDVSLHFHTAPKLPMFQADEAWLVYALTEVLKNAIQYAPPETDIRVRITKQEHAVRVSVADQGPGIPPAYLEAIFDPFVRAPNAEGSGLGLGLAICRAVVHAHAGRVWAEKNPDGQGSIFLMDLPTG